MDVVIIKSVIGEELVCEKTSDTHPLYPNCITVSRPRVFQFQQGAEGRMEPTLVPWILLDPDNKSVPISADYIASIIPAPVALVKSYLTAVSGIALA